VKAATLKGERAMTEFILHGIPGSPYVRSALLGLEEKRVDYRLAAMPMGSVRSPEHLGRNPFGRIPVLDHGDFRLYETQAILRYLDDLYPEPAWQPREARARARMNQLAGICDWYVMPDISASITWERMVKPMLLGGTPDEAKIAAALPKAETSVRAIESLMAEPYLAGEALSLADLMLAPHLSYFAATPEGCEIMGQGKLTRWLARMEARPSMQRTTMEKLRAAA
jgi:glutathione S-transferase